ncbi:unnamed protein product [Adineta ricciae]|uniref:Uncharacterized protein n=1 Tax=Adineta ricciae TaxID=249248 RepID=A0A814QVS2_ADIRI|nr:unnamed protein product [Adineta ricciae]
MDELQKAESESVPQSAVDSDTNAKDNEGNQKNSDSTEVVPSPENPHQMHEPEPNALTKASPTEDSDQEPKDAPTESSSATAEADSQQDPSIASIDATGATGDATTASEPETTTEATGEASDTSGELTKAVSEPETTTEATGEASDTSGDLKKAASEPETTAEATGEASDTLGELTKAASEPETTPKTTGEASDTSGELTKAVSEPETTAEATGEASDTSGELTKAASEPETTTEETGEASDTSGELTKAANEPETTAEATGEALDTSGELTKAASEPETTAEATSEGSDTSGELTKAASEPETTPEATGDAVDTSMASTANDIASIEDDTRTVHDDTKKTAGEVVLSVAAPVNGSNGLTMRTTDSTNASDEPNTISDNSVNVEDETKVPDDVLSRTNTGAALTSKTNEPATATNASPEIAPGPANAEDGAKASTTGSQDVIDCTTAAFQDSANTNDKVTIGKDNAGKNTEEKQIVSDDKNEVDPVSNQENLLASPLTNRDNLTSRKSVSVETNEDIVPKPVSNDEDLLQSSNNQIPDERIDQLVNSRITTASPDDRTNVKRVSDDEILRIDETLNRDVEIGAAEEIDTLLEHRKPKPMSNQSNDIIDKIISLSEKFAVVAAIAGILIFLPIAQVVIGSLYKNSCPLNNLIPTYLLVSGILGICLLISMVCMGCVWIFGASTSIQFTNPLDTYYYCDVTVFYGAFITLIITSILVVIFLCGSCCIRAARMEPDEEV